MGAKSYIPTKEGDIVPWTENYVAVANANFAALGLKETDIAALKANNTLYAEKLSIAIAKQAESKSATEEKNIQKELVTDQIRSLTRQIQAHPGVSDGLKAQLGINVPSPTPAPTAPNPPKDLSGEITTGGLCLLKWNRNSNIQRTIFLIESSTTADGTWHIIGSCTRSSYESNISASVGHNYFRVKAQRGSFTSSASNVILL